MSVRISYFDKSGRIRPVKPAGFNAATVLYTENKWELIDATTGRFNVGTRLPGWQSVIKHHCNNINGQPYWMLLEFWNTPTVCPYCTEDMPLGIVALFKLQNMEAMR